MRWCDGAWVGAVVPIGGAWVFQHATEVLARATPPADKPALKAAKRLVKRALAVESEDLVAAQFAQLEEQQRAEMEQKLTRNRENDAVRN